MSIGHSPNDREHPEAVEQAAPEQIDDTAEVDEEDIPILFETVDPEPDENSDLDVTLSDDLIGQSSGDDSELLTESGLDDFDLDFENIELTSQSPSPSGTRNDAPLSVAAILRASSEASPAVLQPSVIPPTPTPLMPPAAEPIAPSTVVQPVARKGENPFLPQHILDRLNQGRRNLVEEIAQSGAALDASAALLRNRTKNDRFTRMSAGEPSSRPESLSEKDQLVNELVDEFMPLIAAELRRRLKRLLNE